MAEKSLVSDLALMLIGAAGALEVLLAGAGADDVLAGGVVPDELLPHAGAAKPTARSAAADAAARLLVKGKMSSMGGAGQTD
jgi:hypothetical protein